MMFLCYKIVNSTLTATSSGAPGDTTTKQVAELWQTQQIAVYQQDPMQ